MNKRAEDLQKAVDLLLEFREGKEIPAMDWNNALVNTCIHMQQLMKENAKLKVTAKKHSLKEKQRKQELWFVK